MPSTNDNSANNALLYELAKVYLTPGTVLYCGTGGVSTNEQSEYFVFDVGFVKIQDIYVKVKEVRNDGVVVTAVNGENSQVLQGQIERLLPFDMINVKTYSLKRMISDFYRIGETVSSYIHFCATPPIPTVTFNYKILDFIDNKAKVHYKEKDKIEYLSEKDLKGFTHGDTSGIY